MSIGDVNSTERGSGARFNTGKPPMDLVPLRAVAAYYRGPFVSEERRAYIAALDAIGRYQAGGGIECLIDAFQSLGNGWIECAMVFDYGRRKYSQRGDCICSAGNAARKMSNGFTSTATKATNNASHSGVCARVATTETSSSATRATENGKQPITESGLSDQRIVSAREHQNASAAHSVDWMSHTRKTHAIDASSASTDSRESSTTPLCEPAAPFAEGVIGCESTTATSEETCAEHYAIPAILALDLSRGLSNGLNAHSPTCGVHKVVPNTGAWNWAKGMAWSVPIACAARHLMAMLAGEVLDAESKLPHRGHVFCNLVMLFTYASTFVEGDDRPKGMLQ